MGIVVYAENFIVKGVAGNLWVHFTRSLCGIALLVCSFERPIHAAPLDTRIQSLQTITSSLTVDVPAAYSRLKNQCASSGYPFVAGGVMAAAVGNTISWPLCFSASTAPVTGVQFDVPIPASFTVISLTAGPSATAAAKSVTGQLIGGVERIIVFGLNQTVIPTGQLATLQIKVGSVTPKLYPLTIDNPIATDGNGNPLVILGISGTIGVH